MGRFEEMGHQLCRRLVVLLTEDDAAPTSVGHTMMMVATAGSIPARRTATDALFVTVRETLSLFVIEAQWRSLRLLTGRPWVRFPPMTPASRLLPKGVTERVHPAWCFLGLRSERLGTWLLTRHWRVRLPQDPPSTQKGRPAIIL